LKIKRRRRSQQVLHREQISITGEADYIIRCAANYETHIVTLGPLVFFSTGTGDAWMLDPQDGLARSRSAGDVRERQLTCTVFFWLAILAVGPGGPLTLHKMLTYALVASLMAGVGALQVVRSKEALSENFRERPWRFFEAVVQYLLIA
jgi:hypothetical protein